ncbi:protein I'm not dead yet-like [Galleria mellonella]|uniref:Protein I'm not dead yet-like n=1 Tax=Galleria mellonella TaxID=7137 RepID=A0A6J3C2T9_GALME|nr:protein I'm not dead yet-like [Galleria mellonella]
MLRKEEPRLEMLEKLKIFLIVHWQGVVCLLTPIIIIPILIPFPGQPHQWCAYTLILMATYWVTECIPLAVTSFLPVLIFPLADVMPTSEVCKSYMNDSIVMFLGSLILASSVEQSGLHKRMAYFTIRIIGYSHLRLLGSLCIVTTFVSMWITNTAATTMMVPINFALLKVFDDQKIIKMYETTADGDTFASDITSCYFCATTFSATVGGIGTLVGTATNLVFKGLFQNAYPSAPEYLSFPKFSAFAVPYMIIMEIFIYLYLAIVYFGFLRPNSAAAKRAEIPKSGKEAAQKAIAEDSKKMGKISFWEIMVILLFGGAMVSFFCRSPQIFEGWGDKIIQHFEIEDKKFVRDSALAMFVSFLMFLLPSTLQIIMNCKAKFHEDLPKGRVKSVLDWKLLNAVMPFSFMFLLGGGFALSNAAKKTGLNDKIGESLRGLSAAPNLLVLLIIIIVVVLITNFASNVAVANVFCPIVMQLAKEINRNPLWYNIAAGYSASYAFLLPVGTPGNLVVQSAAKIPTRKMVKAGLGPTISTIIITWIAISFWAPVIWPDLHTMPDWISASSRRI